MPYIYSGVCLAAMFGSVIYEHQRLKKEEQQLCEMMKHLAERTKKDLISNTVVIPGCDTLETYEA